MAKSRSDKTATLEELAGAFEGAKGVVFANFAGLGVKATTELRRKCRAEGVKYIVAKKTLLKIAFEKASVTGVNPRDLDGGVAAVFGYEDEISAAKLLKEVADTNEALKFVGGMIPEASGWRYLDLQGVTALAAMPSKQQLLGQVVNVMASPLSGLVNVLQGNLRSLVQVLKAIEQAKT